jgi:hypothetical protein
MKDTNELAIIDAKELCLVDVNSLNPKQLSIILKKTPKQYVKKRPAKGGGTWEYVTGGYIKKCLNLMFGWDWDFEIIDEKILIEAKEVIVKGRLTCRSGGRTIVKMQFGNKDIIFRTQPVLDEKGNPIMELNKWNNMVPKTEPSNIPLSVGNDLKAASTDCLKKCASEIGIAADIYNKEDFKEVMVDIESIEYNIETLKKLYNENGNNLSPEDDMNIQRIIEQQEELSYKKAIKLLIKL